MITGVCRPWPAVFVLGWLSLSAAGQELPAPAAAPRAEAVKAPPAVAAPAAGAEEVRFREQTIYIPYEDLRKTFEKEGRGVFLPYEQFRRLWEAARQAELRPPEHTPPVDHLVTEISGEATVTADVMTFRARIRIELLREGWHQVPIRLGDVALTRALIGDEPARLTPVPGGHALVIEQRGKAPRAVDLEVEFARAYTKSPGRNSVSFEAPAAPVSRWDIRIPEPGVKVDVHPLLAATEAPAEQNAAETRILAFVGAAPTVRIEWTPRAEGARGMAALATVQAETRVSIEEGVSRARVHLHYAVSRAELTRLQVDVPEDQRIVNVFDPNVREWAVEAVGQVQRITAQLFEPARETQELVLEMERFERQADVSAPVVQAVGVSRQQGSVAVGVAAGLRAEIVTREGLLQVDPAELPRHLTAPGCDFALRYAALPFSLVLRIEKILPRVLADTLVEVHVRPEQVVVDLLTLFDVERAGVFQFLFDVPAAWEIRQVQGLEAPGAAAAEIEGYHRLENRPERVAVNLSRQARGRVALAMKLHRRLDEADLLAPTGNAATIPLPLPRAARDSLFRESGRLLVYGPESLRFQPRVTTGLRPIPAAEALEGMRSTQAAGIERVVMAFAFGSEDVALTLEAERRKPFITVRQLLTVRIESGVARFQARFLADILYSGVKSLRVDVPEAIAGQVRVTAQGVQHSVMEVPEGSEPVAAGYVAWRLVGSSEFLGTVTIPMAWDQKIDKLDVGAGADIPVPRLIPRDADRSWGQVVLAKAESIDITPVEPRSGLRPIDPQHDLMPGAAVADAARAFEFHDDWGLTIRATRYETKDVKATSIERGLVTAVVTRGDLTSMQAVYRMRSARQRLTVHLPGEVAFDTQPLHINGRPVPLEQGAAGEFFIPLTGQTPGQPFVVELRYTVRGGGRTLECPAFPEEPATQQVYLSAYLPRELAFLGYRGPWNGEFVWVLRGFTSWPRASQDQGRLHRWVAEGILDDPNSLSSFATDGRHILFSTLRPPAGPDGALRIVAVRDLALQAAVIALGMLIGLWLLPARLPRRALAVGILGAGMLLLAVFLPSLAHAMVTNAAVAGALLVFILWTLWYVVVTRPRDPLVLLRRRDREAARHRLAEPAPTKPPPGAPAAEAATSAEPPPLPDTDEPAAAGHKQP
ncbi:MAG: hypothetical protein JXR77_04445 [Lentisphaeria bacterium]|nr:hypothetical protein [Lentisphaeria bacterium]